jgi:hypothetical protein
MSVRSGQSVTKEFRTRRFDTGVLTDADGTPTGTLYVDGVAAAAAVTITHHSTGRYHAAVTLPSLSRGAVVELEIAATVNGVGDADMIWSDTIDAAPSSASSDDDTSASSSSSGGDGTAIGDAIAANAVGPASVTTDAGSMTQHSIPDQIAADKHLASKSAASKPLRGLRLTKLLPPGAV